MRWPRSLFSSRQTVVFGLDISSSAVKLIELRRIDNVYSVHAYGQHQLPAQVIVGNAVQDIPALAHAIQVLLSQLNLWSRPKLILQAVIAVPDACTFSKTIPISDSMNDHALEELVSLELDKYLPGSLDNIYFDFKRSDAPSQSGLRDVLIVAARMQYVQDRVAALRCLGLATVVVDIESLAIQRMLPFIVSQSESFGITLVLDVSACCVKVFFFKQGHLIFMHEDEFAPEEQHLSRQEDEMSVLQYQNSLMLKIKRACHFFHATYSQSEPVVQMIVSGCGAKRPNLLVWLQQQMERPVFLANPFTQMQVATDLDAHQLDCDAPLYLTACGLAKRVC